MSHAKRKIQLCASMLCADPGQLLGEMEQINRAGVHLMHVDIMDGHYVPNMTGGADVAKCIRRHSAVPCDYHLMILHPENMVEDLELVPGERAAFHVENVDEPLPLLRKIRSFGAKAGVAVNPGTPINKLLPLFPELDYMLVLIVNPGFKGQPVIGSVLEKMRRIASLRDELGYGFRILVDGAVTPENMLEIVECGADDLVCGPFTCFNKALGGIEPTLALVKKKLFEAGYDVTIGGEA